MPFLLLVVALQLHLENVEVLLPLLLVLLVLLFGDLVDQVLKFLLPLPDFGRALGFILLLYWLLCCSFLQVI